MEGDSGTGQGQKLPTISIHTLRMEGDGGLFHTGVALVVISIHTLRMEGDAVFVLRLF